MDIKELYKKIPKFECIEGCNECCGPVPVAPQEAKVIKIKGCILPHSKKLTCKFSSKQGCTIYENRPLLCRLFGVVQKMACPCGGKPERILSLQEEDEIMRAYNFLSSLV